MVVERIKLSTLQRTASNPTSESCVSLWTTYHKNLLDDEQGTNTAN